MKQFTSLSTKIKLIKADSISIFDTRIKSIINDIITINLVTNEHTNGLIRQYLPKKTDFTQISKEDVIIIQERLNHRPRKVLNYRTPYEVFFEEFAKEVVA